MCLCHHLQISIQPRSLQLDLKAIISLQLYYVTYLKLYLTVFRLSFLTIYINVIKLMWNKMLLVDLTVPELVVWECGMKWKEMLSLQQWPGSWTVVMQKRPTDPLLQHSVMDWYITLIKYWTGCEVHEEIWMEWHLHMKKQHFLVTHKLSSKFTCCEYLLRIQWSDWYCFWVSETHIYNNTKQ